jgi:hypothetical protein
VLDARRGRSDGAFPLIRLLLVAIGKTSPKTLRGLFGDLPRLMSQATDTLTDREFIAGVVPNCAEVGISLGTRQAPGIRTFIPVFQPVRTAGSHRGMGIGSTTVIRSFQINCR